MANYQLSEQAKLRRQRTNEAIALAMQNKWEEAAAINRSIIEVFPDDVGAFNRLGKALTELGRYTKAREAYARALEIKPHNSIAKKNLERLSYLREPGHGPTNEGRVSPDLFIKETGKTEVADLHRLASPEVLAKITAGAPVNLKPKGQGLTVESISGEYIGEVSQRLGLRLAKLIEGGNKYAAAIARMGEDEGKVVIKEVFRHPSQAGRPSFPARAADGFRPYVKNSVLKYELEEQEEPAEEEHPSSWVEEPEADEVIPLEDAAALEENYDEDELEED